VSYDTLPDSDPQPVLGAGVRAFPEDMNVKETEHQLLVLTRNYVERGQPIPWMGRAIFSADDTPLQAIRDTGDTSPEEIRNSGPNYGVLFTDADTRVDYAFLSGWSLDGTVTSWTQFQELIDGLQTELSHPVTITPVGE
jgi:hypothetical protein